MQVAFSDKTNEILFDVSDFSGKELKNLSDTGTLIEITKGRDDNEQFEKLIFNGKYVYGLKKVMEKDVSISDEAKQKIFDQFQSALEALIRIIKEALKNEDQELKSYFETKYLLLTHENVMNLLSLSGDLALCKEYYNSLK